MHNLVVRALLGAIGLLLLAILVVTTPKNAPFIQSGAVSHEGTKTPTSKELTPPDIRVEITGPFQITKESLVEESVRMNRIDPNPQATTKKLKQAAAQATAQEVTLLRETVMDPQAGDNERALALHLLALNPNTPTEEFYKIASMSEEPSGRGFHDRLVSVLAVAALEQIQNRALENPSLKADITRLSERSKDQSVREMAKEMSQALRKGKLIRAEVR